LVRCDWTWPANIVPGQFDASVPMVANFGSDAEGNITRLREAFPEGPKVCGEFWTGWFDWFGAPRNGDSAEIRARQRADLEWMLRNDVSFSLYMFHGGTSFGFSAGANDREGGYRPYVTSYDYFAPVDEQGRTRPKYHEFRSLLAEHTSAPLPEPPEPIPVAPIAEFQLQEWAPMLRPGRTPDHSLVLPVPMEHLGLDQGCILYRTNLEGRAQGRHPLHILDLHDYARVFMNGVLVGTLDRRLNVQQMELEVPATGPAVLEILVEAMGRVNFGPAMADDLKGITRRVELGLLTLHGWEVELHPLSQAQLSELEFSSSPVPRGRPAFRRGGFELAAPADTHLDLSVWGKGHVWVNGRHLGRYWSVGPQQTLYLPAPWLRAGRNEVVLLELLNEHGAASLRGVVEPVLDACPAP
jgi:beta-galactosidase